MELSSSPLSATATSASEPRATLEVALRNRLRHLATVTRRRFSKVGEIVGVVGAGEFGGVVGVGGTGEYD